MSNLPKLNENISYINIKLPSGKAIGIRGWKVKDERELLFTLDAEESPDTQKIKHINNFLKKCTNNASAFDQLSEVDLRKIALEIRKLSKGDTIQYSYRCPGQVRVNPADEENKNVKTCNNVIEDEIQLSKSEEVRTFDPKPSVINDKLIIVFKDISYNEGIRLAEKYIDKPSQYVFYYMINSIEAFTYENTSYTEFSEEDLVEFIDGLNSEDMDKIQQEFESKSSSLKLVRKLKCRKCGHEFDVDFGDLYSFLIL